MEPYPLLCEPYCKKVMWGGKSLKKIFPQIKKDLYKIGELWEVSTHPDGLSSIQNSPTGMVDLKSFIGSFPSWFPDSNQCNLPILIKFINAGKNLSVQVHPEDKVAKKLNENENGKTESWYILKAKEHGKIIAGLKNNTTSEDLNYALIHNNKLVEYLETIDIHRGTFIHIPPGTVHAILEQTILLEIQQSSNLTYRVYDWDRLDNNGFPRTLHLEKAKKSIKRNPECFNNFETDGLKNNIWHNLIQTKYYSIKLGRFENELEIENKNKVQILICTKGNFNLLHDAISVKNSLIYEGQVIIIPAGCRNILLKPNKKIEIISVS